nr:JAB domain-containing protein [Pedobacter sp. BAL39]
MLVAAINSGASGIVLAHNHPSMNLAPSKADIDITNQIKQGAALLNIKLIDHLIVTSDGYLSFADRQMLSNRQPGKLLQNFEMMM